MQKIGKLALTLGITLGLSATATTTAQAKTTWHKGTPTALRGKWLLTMPRKRYTTCVGFATQLHITKTRIFQERSNESLEEGVRLSWHKSGKIYYVKSYVKPNGMVLGGPWTWKFYKSGSKLYENVSKHHLKHGYPFKKVAKFRTWY